MTLKKLSLSSPEQEPEQSLGLEHDLKLEAINEALAKMLALDTELEDIRQQLKKSIKTSEFSRAFLELVDPVREEINSKIKHEIQVINESLKTLGTNNQNLNRTFIQETSRTNQQLQSTLLLQDQKLTDLRNIIDEHLKVDLGPVQADISTLREQLSALEQLNLADNQQITGRIVIALDETLIDQQKQLLDLHDHVSAVRSDILENNTDLENKINRQYQDVLGYMDQSEQDQVSVVQTLRSDIQELTEDIDQINSSLNPLASSLQSLTETVNYLQTLPDDLELSSQQIANLNQSLTEQQHRINDVERDLNARVQYIIAEAQKVLTEQQAALLAEQQQVQSIVQEARNFLLLQTERQQLQLREDRMLDNRYKLVLDKVSYIETVLEQVREQSRINQELQDSFYSTQNNLKETSSKKKTKKTLAEENTREFSVKTPDPLTPVNQQFVTFDQLRKHYEQFVQRIQNSLMSLGGGGSTRLRDMDDIDFVSLDFALGDIGAQGYSLVWNSSIEKWQANNVISSHSVLGNLSVSGILTVDGNVVLNDATADNLLVNSDAEFLQDLTVRGNLLVTGNTTFFRTETIEVDDNIIILNANVSGVPTENAGIEVERGTSNNAVILWNETTDRWETTVNGVSYIELPDQGLDITDSPSFVDLTLTGGDLTVSTTTFNLANTVATAANVLGSATSLLIGARTGTVTLRNPVLVGTETTQNVYNTVATTVNAFGAATSLVLSAATGTTNIRNNLDVDGDVNIDGGDLTVSTATFNLANTTATTVNAFGAATAVNIGAATGTLTTRNPVLVGTETTQNVYNTVATTVNAFGAATSLNLGSASGNTLINNSLRVAGTANINSLTVNNGVVFATNSGRLNTSTNITWNGSALSVNGNFDARYIDVVNGFNLNYATANSIPYLDSTRYLVSSSNLTFNNQTLGLTGNLNITGTANISSLNTGDVAANLGNLNSWVRQHNTTTGIIEGSNLYYTNARVWANIAGGSLTTTYVPEGSNLYYTNARVWANINPHLNAINSTISALTTAAVAEGANLYFTNARARAAVKYSVNALSNSNFTLGLVHDGNVVYASNANIIVPNTSTVGFEIGSEIIIATGSAGIIVDRTNVLTEIYLSGNTLSGAWIVPARTRASLVKLETEVWLLDGQDIVRF